MKPTPIEKALDVLWAARCESGRLKTIELLKKGDSPELRFLLQVGLDPFITLGVTVAEQPGPPPSSTSRTLRRFPWNRQARRYQLSRPSRLSRGNC